MSTFHCPHATPNCSTCENSAAARELRDLRRVFREAKRFLKDPTSIANLEALKDYVAMAEETATR